MTDDDVDPDVPDWFWDVIHATKPNVAVLEAWLMTAPKQTVEQFGYHYDTAALELADYWDGIRVGDTTFSEDDMEDLCHWIVSQGRAYWQSVIDGDRTLVDAAETYRFQANHWNPAVADPAHHGYQSPSGIAHGVYWSRFGELLNAVIDEPDYRPTPPA